MCTHPSPTASPGRVPASFMASPCCPHSSPLLLLEVGTSYYAVAVVKRSSNVTINTLKGVRSCHTGINRTVGWNVPVGYLVESGRLSVMGCDVLKGESLWHAGASPAGAPGFPSLCRYSCSPHSRPPESLPPGSPSSCTSFKEQHSPTPPMALPVLITPFCPPCWPAWCCHHFSFCLTVSPEHSTLSH